MDIRILLLPALAAASAASAQGTAPADAARAAAPIPYRSAFAGYRAWQEPAPMNWREANETAGALGGHMGHVRGRSPSAAAHRLRPRRGRTRRLCRRSLRRRSHEPRKGRPKGEYRSAQREGSPMAAARGRMAAAACALLLAGCATFSSDGGMDDVTRLAQERIGAPAAAVPAARDADAARARSDALLRAPLTADAAVEVALLQQSRAARAAGRTRTRRSGPRAGGTAAQSGVRVLEQAQRRRHADRAHGARQRRGARDDAARARDRGAPVRASEARDRGGDRRDRGGGAAGVRARRGGAGDGRVRGAGRAVGGSLERARAPDAAGRELEPPGADARAGVLRRRDRAARAGAAGGGGRARAADAPARADAAPTLAFVLPARLPDLPATPFAPADAERTAMERRLDVQIAKRRCRGRGEVARTHARHALRQRARGRLHERVARPATRARTATRSSSSCRCSTGARRASRAPRSATGRRWRARRRSRSTRDRRCARRTPAYRTAYDLARHYRDEIVPLRKRISEENLLRYNGMLIGVFELLADAPRAGGERDRRDRGDARLLARRHERCRLALTGRSPGAGLARSGDAPALPAAAAGGH